MEKLQDIRDVCKLFGITSRTLRYYEEKGLISSTLLGNSRRRQYSDKQIAEIKNVVSLRTLGIPIAKILQLKKDNADIRKVIAEHRINIISTIYVKQSEINLLEEALHIIEKGGDIFSIGKQKCFIETNENQLRLAKECTDALLNDNYEYPERFFCTDMKNLLNADSLKYAWKMVTKDIGCYEGKKKIIRDLKISNCIFVSLNFEKICLSIKYVFHQNEIYGLWFNYKEKECG